MKSKSLSLARRVASFGRSALLSKPARAENQIAAANRGPLIVAGLFRTGSGIGESARSCANALEAHDKKVSRVDLSDTFRQQDLDIDDFPKTLPDSREGVLILHLNAPETVKGLNAVGYRGDKNWRVIGYWVWELEKLPSSWISAAKHLTEIWTPSEFSANAIRKAVNIPVKVAPHFVSPPAIVENNSFRRDMPEDAVVTLVMGDSRSSHDRKNLLGGVKAFLDGVGDDPNAWLIIKTRNFENQTAFNSKLADHIKNHSRIRIIDQSVSDTEKWQLINSCDIFLSLHRSEGFGLVIAEAMALGKAVIATAWSGNMEFMTPQSARLVPYTLVPTEDQAGIYSNMANENRWADPDLEAATNFLAELAGDKNLRAALGAEARKISIASLSGRQYVELLRGSQTEP